MWVWVSVKCHENGLYKSGNISASTFLHENVDWISCFEGAVLMDVASREFELIKLMS